jgi:hypothetical protein
VEPRPHPEFDAPPAPDHRASFAEVAQAVDVVTTRAPEPAAPVFSEDLLPQRLPKRGRRSSKLQTPWSREKPSKQAPSPAAALAPPPQPAAESDAPAPDAGSENESPAAVGTNGDGPLDSPPSSDGGERFAFFAAFRAAAERAREEAGIDDRRVGH